MQRTTTLLLYEGPWVAARYVATLPLIEEQPDAVFPVVRDIIAPGGKPTSAEYRLFALQEKSPQRPALVRVGEGGAAIEVEVWRFPTTEVGSFLKGIAAPLGLGSVTLRCDPSVCGFIAEAVAGGDDSTDVTHFGGWRAYLQAQAAAPQ